MRFLHYALITVVVLVLSGCSNPGEPVSSRMNSHLSVGQGISLAELKKCFDTEPYIVSEGLILHTDGFIPEDICRDNSGNEIVSNEVVAGLPSDVPFPDILKYLETRNIAIVGIISSIRCVELKILDGRFPPDVVAGLKEDGLLKHPETNPIVRCASFPNDPAYNKDWFPDDDYRWAFERIQAVEAWDYFSDNVINESGSADVGYNTVFAIIDTGIILHQDFNLSPLNLWVMQNFGKNFIQPGQLPIDDHLHGTMVTGSLSANGNNAYGLAGMAWKPSIIPIKSISSEASGSGFSVELGIAHVRSIASQYPFTRIITNISIGFQSEEIPYWISIAVEYLDQAPNAIIVCASGNNNNDKNLPGLSYDISADNYYPAALPECLSVGASSRLQIGGLDKEVSYSDTGVWGSNWGETVDLCAPGSNNIYSTSNASPTSFTDHFGATSASACFVSGVAALLWSLHPDWTREQVHQKIIETANPMTIPPEKTGLLGSGRVNAFRAISE